MSRSSRSARYPVMLDVNGRLVVVIGATRAAERMATAMASRGADVVIISPVVPPSLLEFEASGALTIESRSYVRGDLAGAFIAVAASGSAEIDAAVRDEAQAEGVLLSVLADGDASDFTVPSVVRRGPLQIAVSTGGVAPAVARRVRREISASYGPEWGVYAALLGAVRTRAIELYGLDDAGLTPLFDAIAASGLLERIGAGEDPSADDVLAAHSDALALPTDTDEEDL